MFYNRNNRVREKHMILNIFSHTSFTKNNSERTDEFMSNVKVEKDEKLKKINFVYHIRYQ